MLTSGSFVLYMIYFPPHLKYLSVDVDADTAEPATYGSTQTQSTGHRLVHVNTAVRTDAWRASMLLAWVVVLHLYAFRAPAHLTLMISQRLLPLCYRSPRREGHATLAFALGSLPWAHFDLRHGVYTYYFF
jgi:hypothetical protein